MGIIILLRPGLSPMLASGYLRPVLHTRCGRAAKFKCGCAASSRELNPPAIKAYDVLIDFGPSKYHRVKYGENKFVYWVLLYVYFGGLVKTRQVKFKNISKKNFYLYLKECKFRFNYRNHDIYRLLQRICRNN